eukprot:TRINITY_DN5785_c0_g1_i2.p1 TRINITY_DN5785_c0_g1~~TRINITY_DN5785_c0_g1_i2.p1  ORF type:complete len:101 (+),score=24.99 TRINITY_DN5785_c0_g1_i2:671-973(+)
MAESAVSYLEASGSTGKIIALTRLHRIIASKCTRCLAAEAHAFASVANGTKQDATLGELEAESALLGFQMKAACSQSRDESLTIIKHNNKKKAAVRLSNM